MKNGTEKQISWAKKIQQQHISGLVNLCKNEIIFQWLYDHGAENMEVNLDELKEKTIKILAEKQNAQWWINNRQSANIETMFDVLATMI